MLGLVDGTRERGVQRSKRVQVLHLDAQATDVEQQPDLDRRAGVHHRVGDELAGHQDGRVDQVGGSPRLELTPHEPTRPGHRALVRRETPRAAPRDALHRAPALVSPPLSW